VPDSRDPHPPRLERHPSQPRLERCPPEAFPELAERSSDSFIADRIAPLLRESTLWPVLIVLMAHLAAFGAWSLVMAVQERRLYAYLGVFGLFWLTGTAAVAEIRQTRRPGPLTTVILLTWLLTAGFYFAARHWNIV